MLFALTLSLAVVAAPDILFVGNSHTASGDVPSMVRQLLNGEKQFENVRVASYAVSHLNQWGGSRELVDLVRAGGIKCAVLQGAEISSSHKYTYSQAEGIDLAKKLRAGGTQVLFVSEWPRRGCDETAYIEAVYLEMAKESGGTVIPVGQVWDAVRKRLGGIDLWQSDGNHATLMGSYLSARTIAWHLGGRRLDYVPEGIGQEYVSAVDAAVRDLK